MTEVNNNIVGGSMMSKMSSFSPSNLLKKKTLATDPTTAPAATAPTAPATTDTTDTTDTTVPDTTVPDTTVPATTVPDTTVPDTTVPDTTVPDTTDTTVPATTASASSAKKSNPESLITFAKDKLSVLVGNTLHKIVGSQVDKIIDKIVPVQLANVPKIKELVDNSKAQIAEIQENMVEHVTKNALDSVERDVYVVPIIGEVAAAVTSVDSLIASGRNAWAGISKMKEKINTIEKTIKDLSYGNVPSIPGIPNFSDSFNAMKNKMKDKASGALSSIKDKGNSAAESVKNSVKSANATITPPLQQGGIKTRRKNSNKILNRTRKSLQVFYNINKNINKNKKTFKNKHKKNYTNKILNRTKKSLQTFHSAFRKSAQN